MMFGERTWAHQSAMRKLHQLLQSDKGKHGRRYVRGLLGRIRDEFSMPIFKRCHDLSKHTGLEEEIGTSEASQTRRNHNTYFWKEQVLLNAGRGERPQMTPIRYWSYATTCPWRFRRFYISCPVVEAHWAVKGSQNRQKSKTKSANGETVHCFAIISNIWEEQAQANDSIPMRAYWSTCFKSRGNKLPSYTDLRLWHLFLHAFVLLTYSGNLPAQPSP